MQLPPIPPEANKYSRGSLLVLGGSTRFVGAAVLAARAAARTGAGYVTLAVPASVAPIAQAHLLSIPVIAAREVRETLSTEGEKVGVFSADAFAGVLAALSHLDAIVCGPGLSAAPSALACALEVACRAEVPLLLDADALRVVSELAAPQLLSPSPSVPELAASTLQPAQPAPTAPPPTSQPVAPSPRQTPARPLVLTPHAGELARLLDATHAHDSAELAQRTGALIVAKGPETRVTTPPPLREWHSSAATPALAKAGTGDVLAGIIGSLLAQGMEPFEAACAGVTLHSKAGCIAEQRFGQRSVMAEDIIAALPAALQELT